MNVAVARFTVEHDQGSVGFSGIFPEARNTSNVRQECGDPVCASKESRRWKSSQLKVSMGEGKQTNDAIRRLKTHNHELLPSCKVLRVDAGATVLLSVRAWKAALIAHNTVDTLYSNRRH